MIRRWLVGIVREALRQHYGPEVRGLTLKIEADVSDAEAALERLTSKADAVTVALERANVQARVIEENADS